MRSGIDFAESLLAAVVWTDWQWAEVEMGDKPVATAAIHMGAGAVLEVGGKWSDSRWCF